MPTYTRTATVASSSDWGPSAGVLVDAVDTVDADYAEAAITEEVPQEEPLPPEWDARTRSTGEILLTGFFADGELGRDESIDTVTVRVWRNVVSGTVDLNTPDPDAIDLTVQLRGVVGSAEWRSSNKANVADTWSLEQQPEYTGDAAYWGVTFTPSRLDSSFGIVIAAQGVASDDLLSHTWTNAQPYSDALGDWYASIDKVEIVVETTEGTAPDPPPSGPADTSCDSGVFNDAFVLDGWLFLNLPALVVREPIGVRAVSRPVLSGGRVVHAQGLPLTFPSTVKTDFPLVDARRSLRQAWRLTWDESSPMERALRDFLRAYWTLNHSFWWQYDAEFTFAEISLEQDADNYLAFTTPTWPIAPYGYTPLNERSWDNMLLVDGTPVNTGFEIDHAAGVVLFDVGTPEETLDVPVKLSYTFRAYVSIASLALRPLGPDTGDDAYVGDVVLQQMRPDHDHDHWFDYWTVDDTTWGDQVYE